MATFVLVHGGNMSTETWNRLRNRNDYPPGGRLGPRYWDGTAACLEAHGHMVFAPALGDEYTHNLSDHVGQVCQVIERNGLTGIILVGHSYGGFVITGVADRLARRIRHLVFLDSGLPDPNESLMDLLTEGDSGKTTAVLPDPAPAYTERIRYDPAVLRSMKKTYIRCTKSEFIDFTRRSKEKVDAAPAGEWMYREIRSSHVPMADQPARFNRMILELACQ